MISALLLALFPLQEPAGQVRAFDPKTVIDAEVLADELDLALHWLHTRFDKEGGTYGGLTADAWAVLAFAEAPRKYRPADGPFLARPMANLLAAQQPDGSVRGLDSMLAWRAFDAVPDAAPRAAAEKLRAQLGATSPCAKPASVEAALAHAQELLISRKPNGSFGDVVASAQAIHELDHCHALLKEHEPKAAPRATQALPRFSPPSAAEIDAALLRGARFLLTQRVDGGWGFGGQRDAGITAMVVGGLLEVRERPSEVQAATVQALDALLALQHADGSIHDGQLANYVTSASVLALAKSGRPQDLAAVQKARAFLVALQADEGEGYSSENRFYGGVGYGDDEKPDLSNMQHALEALNAAGLSKGDATYQKALAFLQRCQNRSESNDLALVRDGQTFVSGNDGGATYAPADSKAGFYELADGKRVPRSYGSMSYALLKCYLFAGLDKSDARVQAVWKWIRENYTLDVNPGFQFSDDPAASYHGLFYYFHTMAKALALYGDARVTDAAGVEHDWRAELCGRLVAMQRGDGSWLNENSPRWFEGNPSLATAYALMTLGAARAK